METPLPWKALRKFMRLRVCFFQEILGERFRFCPVPGARNCVNLHLFIDIIHNCCSQMTPLMGENIIIFVK